MSQTVPEANRPASATKPQSCCLLADDATATDQLALSVFGALSGRVITLDGRALGTSDRRQGLDGVWVINTATRALEPAAADQRSRAIANELLRTRAGLPLLQIDSRLRGIGNFLRGIYQSYSFDCLVAVPAEPELGRLTKDGNYYHVEEGRRVLFHQSCLARSFGRALEDSDLRSILAAELGIPGTNVVSLNGKVISDGPDAIVSFLRALPRRSKCVVVPDIETEQHFEAVGAALKRLGPDEVLVAGSRTFFRSFLNSFQTSMQTDSSKSLAQVIDRQKRGAPLAVICSLEPAMQAQIAYAQRALGPNLVTVVFDANVILAGADATRSEVERVRPLLAQSLRAMRPVLLQSSGAQLGADPGFQQKLLDAISQVVADKDLQQRVTALLIAGGQTAETIRAAAGISAVEAKGAFQESIPWGVPIEGAFQGVPLVTKGGAMGAEDLLFAFFEQGHSLPRANVLPVVTPLTSAKQIDEAGIEKLIAHLLRLGLTDIFPVGNAGEFRFLTNPQRLQALELFARKGRGKLRVFAGVTGDTPEETISNYVAAGKVGVFAAVMMPLYFLKRSEDIAPFVSQLASTGCKLPLVLYNNPERTGGQHIAFEAVEALSFPVVALKDSSGDPDRLARYASLFPVYQGQQRQFLEDYRKGARGAVAIIGHVSALPNEFFAAAATEARREEIAQQLNALSKVVKQGGAEVAAYKYVLSLMGVMGDTVASNEAARELTPAQREQIRLGNTDLVSAGRMSA